MTRKQYTKKINELIRTASKDLRKLAQKAWASGAIDPPSYGDDYRLPKIVLHAALLSEAWQWESLSADDKADSKNLEHFI